MFSTRKIVTTVAAGSVLLMQALASHAVTFTVTVPDPAATQTQSTFITGVQSSSSQGGFFNASLLPSGVSVLNDSSTVSYGITQIGGGGPGKTDFFKNATATFTFDVLANGVTNRFLVNGVIADTAGPTSIDTTGTITNTGAKFVVNSVQLLNSGALFTTTRNSPTNTPSFVVSNVQFGNTFANIFVDASDQLPPPNGSFLSVGGYVQTVVPEPGSVALMTGMGVTAAGFLARRRRARKA